MAEHPHAAMHARLGGVNLTALAFGLGFAMADPGAPGNHARIIVLIDELSARGELAAFMASLDAEMRDKVNTVYRLSRGVIYSPAAQRRLREEQQARGATTGEGRPIRLTLRDETGRMAADYIEVDPPEMR